MSDKDFKVKNKLQVKGITSAGPVVSDASGNIDSTAYIATQYGGTGTSTSPNAGEILYSASGTTYAPASTSVVYPSQTGNSGKYFLILSSRFSKPLSSSIKIDIAVNCFVTDANLKLVIVFIPKENLKK